MPVYGPADIYNLQRGACHHDFSDESKRYSAPLSSDETRSLPVLTCSKGCEEWALSQPDYPGSPGWKTRPEQVRLTQTEIDNEIANATDARGGINQLAEAISTLMNKQQQGVISDGVDVRQAPTRARKTR